MASRGALIGLRGISAVRQKSINLTSAIFSMTSRMCQAYGEIRLWDSLIHPIRSRYFSVSSGDLISFELTKLKNNFCIIYQNAHASNTGGTFISKQTNASSNSCPTHIFEILSNFITTILAFSSTPESPI